jgi:hypothetical protein
MSGNCSTSHVKCSPFGRDRPDEREIPVVDPNKIAAATTASQVEEKITHISGQDQEINRLAQEISDLRIRL